MVWGLIKHTRTHAHSGSCMSHGFSFLFSQHTFMRASSGQDPLPGTGGPEGSWGKLERRLLTTL